jgi:hypothetical protein
MRTTPIEGFVAVALIVPQDCSETRQKFADMKWLRQVIIGSCVERCNFVLFAIPYAENQDGGSAPFANVPKNFETSDVWKIQVEQNHLRLVSGCLHETISAISCFENTISIAFKCHSK